MSRDPVEFEATVGDQTHSVRIHGDLVEVDGEPIDCRLTPLGQDAFVLHLPGSAHPLHIVQSGESEVSVTSVNRTTTVRLTDRRSKLLEQFGMASGTGANVGDLKAPMPGLVVDILVKESDEVSEGQGILVLEAMKMENELGAAAAGIVSSIEVSPGDAVRKGEVLVTFAASAAEST